ncbi:hypothetical protein SAMD00019534_053580 [Acytostelium subglobosum LB1]|uniref:hypothetical protein n=1 Tax=Acytostelium subglobosum LB1 TaxID=1410327 RepID=UPI0006447D31|nr:hypothetical protein SAMD00019534_053580 [Acytostelium subglobosum LB1]GAM22183.1 hypothetical protein SAMD00019534_053580 [Acytostelium subglobosum LB1]|eukprot:XP_012755283.1 hypothetical protein SAMD00019534_053580 [Acytostelium subglobosum LB1]
MPATYSTTRLNNLDCQMRHYKGAYNRDTIRMIAQRLSDDLYFGGSAARLEVAIESYVRVVHLKLTNEHYTLDKEGAFEPKGIILKRYNDDRIPPYG